MGLVQKKIADVWAKGYITKEMEEVVSVMSFFDVPKREEDIRMVYNTTSSGLNATVWEPWFCFPTVETH